MKVTLGKFLEIVGNNLIEPYICTVMVVTYDEDYGEITNQLQFSDGVHTSYTIKDINLLVPYHNYEITHFEQYAPYGELDEQVIWLREIKEEVK